MINSLKSVVLLFSLLVSATAGAQESVSLGRYGFADSGKIVCIVRVPDQGCSPLPSAISGDNIKRYAAELEALLPQISEGGQSRAEIASILATASIDIDVLDTVIKAEEHVWHNARIVDNFQVKLGNTHVLFLEFNSNTGVFETGDVVPIPDNPFVFRSNGDFVRCGQQALQNAGFDPNGVDGALGGGAKRALASWAEENDINVPAFANEFASQICYLLTSPQPRFGGQRQVVNWTLWPIWSGNVFYNENSVLMEGMLGDSVDGKPKVLQLTKVDFGDGLRFGDQDNQDMDLPWLPKGSVFLHGTDAIDGIDGSRSPFAAEMLRLIDALSRETGLGSFRQMAQTKGVWYPGIRRALGAIDEVGDLPPSPEWQVLWSVVDEVDGSEIVAADFMLHNTIPDTRLLVFMAYDPDGVNSQLLYASVATMEPPKDSASSGFSQLSGDQLMTGLFDADCQESTGPTRSLSVGNHDGFSAFPTRLCSNGNSLLEIVVWTKTNSAGTQLSAVATLPDGGRLPIVNSFFDDQSSSNIFEVGGLAVDGKQLTCSVVKPSGGISVFGESFCE